MILNCRDKLADLAANGSSDLSKSPRDQVPRELEAMREETQQEWKNGRVPELGKWPDQGYRILLRSAERTAKFRRLVSVAYRPANFSIYSRNSRRRQLKYSFPTSRRRRASHRCLLGHQFLQPTFLS